MTIDELQEHCEKVVNPNNKLVFDINSKTYQEHKLILDIIEELKDMRLVMTGILGEMLQDRPDEFKLYNIKRMIDDYTR